MVKEKKLKTMTEYISTLRKMTEYYEGVSRNA